MECFHKWSKEKNLKPSEIIYLVRTNGPKKEAQFSKSGDPSIERAYSTHYISPALSEEKQRKLKEKLEKAVKELKEDGTIAALKTKWFGEGAQ